MRRRRLRGKGEDGQPINKADIQVTCIHVDNLNIVYIRSYHQVVPSTELMDCNKYFDVVKVASVENIYEELPSPKDCGEEDDDGEEEEAKYENVISKDEKPPQNNNFPDVKISVL